MESTPEFSSIIPIIITLIVSLVSRNVVVGLFTGVLVGIAMIEGLFINQGPLDTFGLAVTQHFLPQVTDSYNAGIIILLVFIGGFVALVERSGGGVAFAARITQWVRTKCQATLTAWFGGIVIFFSDLGTPLIVGPVFRSLFDSLKLSRQKLAFIIDSTSSPVAILVPFIGWGVYIMGLIQKEFDALNYPMSDWQAFIQAIPFQFYAILAITVVPIIALLKLDFGPMAQAETLAQKGSDFGKVFDTIEVFSHPNAKASFVFVPLAVMLAVLFAMLVPHGFPFERVSGGLFRGALTTAYFSAAMTLIALMGYYGVRRFAQSLDIYLKGMAGMMSVAIILILAWTLSAVGKELGAAAYITEQAQAGFAPWLLPAAVFLIAAVISFATGSSWGTFAIMMSLVLPTAIAIDAPLVVCIGAVLSGGLFGDHCSPLSETTILASTGAGCDQFEHFRTQFPYAFTNGLLALAAFLMAGFFESSLIFLGVMALQLVVYWWLHQRTAKQHALAQQTA